MSTILVTAAGGNRVGVGAVEWLNKETDHEIIGVDMHRNAGGLYRCDKRFQVPAATDDSWAQQIADIIDNNGVSVVIPSIDASLQKIPTVNRLTDRDVVFLAAREEIVSMAFDKYDTMSYLAERGISVPETVVGDSPTELSTNAYPAVVKPRTGQGNSLGSGVEIVGSPREATEHISSQDRADEEFIIQEHIDGVEYTTGVLGTTENDLLAVAPKEAVSSTPYHRVTRDVDHIRSACTEMFHTLEPAGVLNIQHIVKDGTPYTIEINPRFSSSSALTAAAGINGYKLLVADALGENVTVNSELIEDCHLLHSPSNVYVDEL